jgi:sulfatase modifying factor 1
MGRVFVALVALLAACGGNDHFLRVTLVGLPDSTITLRVFSSLGNDVAPSVDFQVKSVANGQTFVLDLPVRQAWFLATIAALGDGDCDLAIGTVGLANSFTGTNDVLVNMAAQSGGDCNATHTPGMVPLPMSMYTLGCTTTTDPDCTDDESPMFSVQSPAFEIAASETTHGLYDDCVATGPCTEASLYSAGLLPDESAQNGLSWDQARAFCQWMNGALPSEAEWEGAMRNGSAQLYPWGDDVPDCKHANYSLSSTSTCVPYDEDAFLVDQYLPGKTQSGIFDGGGNVAEWTNDWYAARSTLTDDTVLTGPAAGPGKVAKGGSLIFLPTALRGASRVGYETDGTVPNPPANFYPLLDMGVRCARAR